MKIRYIARVTFVSFELVILMVTWLLVSNFGNHANSLAKALNINDEFIKYLILLPLGLFGWIIKEVKDLIFADAEHAKQLINWPDYWKLKVHIYVCFFYALVFCLMSTIPWLSRSGISDGKALIVFISGIVGTMWVAASVYFAQMSVKEIFNIEHNS